MSESERRRTDDLIRPILRGRDIKRYGYNFAGWYLIATHNGIPEKDIPRIDIDDYPAVKVYLDKYWDKISVRAIENTISQLMDRSARSLPSKAPDPVIRP